MSEETQNKGYHSSIMHQCLAYEINRDMKYNPKCLCDNTCCARQSNCRACMAFHKLTAHDPTCRYLWKWDEVIKQLELE